MKFVKLTSFSIVGKHGGNLNFRQLLTLILFIFIFSLTTNAQEIKKNYVCPANTSKITIRIKGLSDENMTSNLKNTFRECKGKLLEYEIDEKNNEVTVIISDKLQPVDLLEVLEMHGINAGYLNEKKELVVLDEGGDLSEPIKIAK
ncbi:MAG: hypothetical protein ABI855_15160 [Bacteroidota bacterium]